MFYFIVLILGLIIGILLKDKIVNWSKEVFLKKKITYNIKFHAYFILHRNGSRLNEMIKTDSITLNVSAYSEDDAIILLSDFLDGQVKIEIESIEVCNQ